MREKKQKVAMKFNDSSLFALEILSEEIQALEQHSF